MLMEKIKESEKIQRIIQMPRKKHSQKPSPAINLINSHKMKIPNQ